MANDGARSGHCPDKARDRSRIDPDLRWRINHVITGREPWPLLIVGGVGTGKTCAALCLCDAVIGTGWRSTYYTPELLCGAIIDAQHGRLVWGSREVSEGEVWERWFLSKLTVLDELGARGNVTDFAYQTVKHAVDSREGRCGMYLSNAGLDELARIYDDRLASRLAAGTVVELLGHDRRMDGSQDGGSVQRAATAL